MGCGGKAAGRARLTLLPSGRAHSELQDIALAIASLRVGELGLGELKVEATKCYWVTGIALSVQSLPLGPSSQDTPPVAMVLCSPVACSTQCDPPGSAD